MPIHQTKKQTDLEKRLKLLKTQVYGRKVPLAINYQLSDTKQKSSDINFLRRDLFKISILASLALGIQIILFYLSNNGILRLNFF